VILFVTVYLCTGLLLALSAHFHGVYAREKRIIAATSLVLIWPLLVLVAPESFFRDQRRAPEATDPLRQQLSSLISAEALPLTEHEKQHLWGIVEAGEAGVTYFGDGADRVLEEFWGSGIPPAAYYALRAARAALREPEPDSGVRFSLCEPDWYIGFSNEFLKSVSSIDRKLRGRVLEAIAKIGLAPSTPVGDTIKPLTGNLSGLWRIRVGDSRLVYYPHAATRRITLISFGPRGSVYAELPNTADLTRSSGPARR